MRPTLPMSNPIDGRVKVTGVLAIMCNAFAVFGILAIEFQSGEHGEMARFYHDTMSWTLPIAGWGIATGIGLLRAWRWARISTLIFSGLLAAFGVLGAVASLRAPGGVGTTRGELIILKTVLTLLSLIPTAAGLALLVFFTRNDVRAYFSSGSAAHSVRIPRGQ